MIFVSLPSRYRSPSPRPDSDPLESPYKSCMAQSPQRPAARRMACHDSRYKALTPCRKTRPADRQPSLAGNDWYPKKSASAPPALAFPPQWIAQLVELVEMAVLEAQ